MTPAELRAWCDGLDRNHDFAMAAYDEWLSHVELRVASLEGREFVPTDALPYSRLLSIEARVTELERKGCPTR